MKRVLVESPYGNSDPAVVAENVEYARACMLDCFRRGEAPFASHLLYTQPGVLDDSVPDQRARGIEAGLVWGSQAELTVVYIDRGITEGMHLGIAQAEAEGRPVDYRQLEDTEP